MAARCKPVRYTADQLNAFKRTLLLRLPACFFTAADVDQLQKETGVEGDRIHQWATNFSKRVFLLDERAKYLSTPTEADKEVLNEIFRQRGAINSLNNMAPVAPRFSMISTVFLL